MKCLGASPPSAHAAFLASGVWIPGIADFHVTVEKHVRVLADILEGFEAETLRSRVRAGVELQCVVDCASAKKSEL